MRLVVLLIIMMSIVKLGEVIVDHYCKIKQYQKTEVIYVKNN
jgi:hypothetical protein